MREKRKAVDLFQKKVKDIFLLFSEVYTLLFREKGKMYAFSSDVSFVSDQ